MQKERITRLSPLQLQAAGLAAPAIPVLPPDISTLPLRDRLAALQAFISAFQYNFVAGYQYTIRKGRPFNQIMQTARDIMRDGLPIKCIEATFLAACLTCPYKELQRYPVGFKSKVAGRNAAFR
jgi:tubulinyl-Tyr carboxypeptidase